MNRELWDRHMVEIDRLTARAEAAEARLTNADQEARALMRQQLALQEEITRLRGRLAEAEAKLNTPELHDFARGVTLEAAHQRERWGVDHDAGKSNEDWFWLVGYLTGKALHAAKNGDDRKALHHTISTAAALANWHAALNGDDNRMQPGHAPSIVLGENA